MIASALLARVALRLKHFALEKVTHNVKKIQERIH